MKKKNRFRSATIACVLWIIAFDFNFGNYEFKWFWTGSEIVPLVLLFVAIIFGTLWFWDNQKYKYNRN